MPPKLTLRNAIDIASKPAWVLGVLMGKHKSFGNINEYIKGKGSVWAPAPGPRQFRRLIVMAGRRMGAQIVAGQACAQGLLDADGARQAADLGADAIVVSNHGGRQLDSAPSTVATLPRMVDAVGQRIEVLFNGGVRSGQDVLKALALDAHGCLIGRAYLYGLAAMGEAGVSKALSLTADELRVTMALTGVRAVGAIRRDILFDYRK